MIKGKHSNYKEFRFAVAPMMDWTDRYCRYFHRLLTRKSRLYTEMVTANAVIHGDRERLLGFDPAEHPVALQLGASEPQALAKATHIGEALGYDEINLNCGCPSDRVQSGCFGAALMADPDRVAECVTAMRAAVRAPITVKCRIGIDEQDPQQSLFEFVDTVARAGCDTFIVHARKAWLKGLSPKENREIPPLDYDIVYRLKRSRPELTIVINGGIGSIEEAQAHLDWVDGVMLGRAAYQTPWVLAQVDSRLFGAADPAPSRTGAVGAYLPFMERELSRGTRLGSLTRPLIGLFQGCPGARGWRRALAEGSLRADAGPELVRSALRCVEPISVARAA